MENLLFQQYGIKAKKVKKLNGYENINYRIEDDTSNYVFKTYRYDKNLLAILIAENQLLLQLQENKNNNFPKPIPFLDGDYIKVISIKGKQTICRMLSFLEGNFLGDVKITEKIATSLGGFLANLDLKLKSIDNDTIKARKWEWDIQHLHLNKKYLQDIYNVYDRNIVAYFMLQFEEKVTPILPELRYQTIHNDANEWNILLQEDAITGLIDFGDLTYAPLINELAVALTYLCYDKKDPIKWAKIVLKAYHKVLPIQEREIELLYYLIAARLCISVCNSAHAKKIDPENNYASSSEQNAWALLKKWLTLSPIYVEIEFKKALDFEVITPKKIESQVEHRHTHISPIVSLSYTEPIYMVKAAFQYMYDAYGHTFLDAYNNIPHVGHSHPKVVQAGIKQMVELNTNTRYHYDLLLQYSEKLLSKFPQQLNKVFFVNSGSAATDLALRLAYAHTKHRKVMVMEHGYHGNTQMAIDISHYKFNNRKGQGQKEYILKTAIPDTFKGNYRTDDGSAGTLYAKDAIKQIENTQEPIAAFISEPIVGCGGQVPLANGYLKEIYPTIRAQGGVCISDEVQTGFGRLGDCFWGFEAQEVIPDIVILGKPMGNGHPIGAVICTDEIAASFSKGVEFFSSFGGNPVSCAIGLSVLEVIEEEKLQENAKIVGDYYMSLFKELQKEFDAIGDVRGSGLFIGVELVKNKELEPHTELAQHIKNELRKRHILISTDGPYDNVLKTKPPLCFTKENAKHVVDTVREILEANS